MATWELGIEKFISKDAINKLLKTCEAYCLMDRRYGRVTWQIRYPLLALFVFTGLRVAEAASLKIRDLHLSASPAYLIVVGKGNKKRSIVLPRGLVKVLKEFIEQKGYMEQSIEPNAPVFCNAKGEHYSIRGLQKSVKKAFSEAGIEKHHSVHHLRHAFASEVVRKGNLIQAKALLGHSNISTTSIYLSADPAETSKTIEKIFN